MCPLPILRSDTVEEEDGYLFGHATDNSNVIISPGTPHQSLPDKLGNLCMFLVKTGLLFFCLASEEVGWQTALVPSIEGYKASCRKAVEVRELDSHHPPTHPPQWPSLSLRAGNDG